MFCLRFRSFFFSTRICSDFRKDFLFSRSLLNDPSKSKINFNLPSTQNLDVKVKTGLVYFRKGSGAKFFPTFLIDG